jgi:hypothetical protein
MIGVNIPRIINNIARTMRTNFGCLNAAPMKEVVVLGGSRAVTVRQEMIIIGTMMKAMIRMAQPKPTEELFSILDSAIGNTTPPIEDPRLLSPRRLRDSCRSIGRLLPWRETGGDLWTPLPIPPG